MKRKENRIIILKAIEDLRTRNGKNPRQMEIARELGVSHSVVSGLIYRMRNEGLLEKRTKGSPAEVYISLKGYKLLEKNRNMIIPTQVVRTREIKEPKDIKDKYIQFLEWIYEVDDNMLLENGWKKEVLKKVKEIFLG